ncbi:MAG: hypothetical protein MK008_10210 [Bdellovibrionales bacterium]|nr:hypothetical protein [Bdellovibrionales bacterium]
MNTFYFERKEEDNKVFLFFFGNIDENASFTGAILDGTKDLVIDLEKVEAINSCGIRDWIQWLKTSPVDCKIEYRNCPKVIVDQMNMIKGFLPTNAHVESFYVPYYSPDADKEKMILYRKGVDFKENSVDIQDTYVDPDNNEEYEIDVIPEKYFKFIQG